MVVADLEGDTPVPGRRFPRHVYTVGSEPDPRFTLANERTFLAWIRTALALLAVAGALLALDLPIRAGWQWCGAMLFALASVVAAAWAWWAWAGTERALRLRRPLPGLGPGAGLVVLVALGLLVLVVGLVLDEVG